MLWFEKRYTHITGRPLVACIPFFLAGLLTPYSLWLLLLVPAAMFLVRGRWLLAAALFGAGFFRTVLTPGAPEPLPVGEYKLLGRVVSTPALAPRSQRIVVATVDREILVYDKPERLVMSGDLVEVEGEIQNIVAYSDAFSQYQYEFWRRRGINQKMNVAWHGGLQVLAPGAGPATLGSAWRSQTWARLRANLNQREAAIAMGVIAGQQSLVDKDLINNMQRSGTLHLLATSGFNVLLLAAGLMFLLSHVPIPRIAQLAIALLILLAYADAVGGRPPVLRAVIMSGVYFSAFAFNRSSDALSSLAFAAMLYLLIEPAGVWDAGFQLSFVTVAGLILFLPGAYARARKWVDTKFNSPGARLVASSFAGVLATTVVAQMASIPLTIAHFGVASLVSPIANLLTAPVVPLMYVGTALAQMADAIWPPLGQGIDFLVNGSCAGWMDAVNSTLGAWPYAAVELTPPAWPVVLAIYLAMLMMSRPARREIPQFEPAFADEALAAKVS